MDGAGKELAELEQGYVVRGELPIAGRQRPHDEARNPRYTKRTIRRSESFRASTRVRGGSVKSEVSSTSLAVFGRVGGALSTGKSAA